MTFVMNASENKNKKQIIELSEVVFSWNKNIPILNIEHLYIQQGERIFIAGPSGSGKTTLLSLIAGIITPRSGAVNVSGQEINHMGGAARDNFRADHIGFIFQMFNLVPYLTVVENVTLPCRFSVLRRERATNQSASVENEAVRLLGKLGLNEKIAAGQNATELSMGQQQRVAAARALIGGPDIVIADEPTSSLDKGHREAFINLLFKECKLKKSTLIFVSHDTSLAPLFDRIIQLNDINQGCQLTDPQSQEDK